MPILVQLQPLVGMLVGVALVCLVVLALLWKPRLLNTQGPLTHEPPSCRGELFGLGCDDPPLHRCHRCKKSLCDLHAFEGDYHRYCYSCLYEDK